MNVQQLLHQHTQRQLMCHQYSDRRAGEVCHTTGRVSRRSPGRRAADGTSAAGPGWRRRARRRRPARTRPRCRRRPGPSGRSPAGSRRCAGSRSSKVSSRSSGVTWASPNERTPGVSITQPPPRSGSAMADEEVCRPLPTPGDGAGRPIGLRHERVDQRRLADPGVPDHHRDRPVQRRSHGYRCRRSRRALEPGAARRVTRTGSSRSAYASASAAGSARSALVSSSSGPARRCTRRPGSGR